MLGAHERGDTTLRPGHWFDIDPQFWLNLQTQYDLVRADEEKGAAIRDLPTWKDLPPRLILYGTV